MLTSFRYLLCNAFLNHWKPSWLYRQEYLFLLGDINLIINNQIWCFAHKTDLKVRQQQWRSLCSYDRQWDISFWDPSDWQTNLKQLLVTVNKCTTTYPLNENYPFHSSPTPLKSQWPHQICIINTAGGEKWWISVRATLAIFSNPSFSDTLLKGPACPTLPQLSSYAQLRCNNPNPHSLQFPHSWLHTHLP